jgi:hypothetical protein
MEWSHEGFFLGKKPEEMSGSQYSQPTSALSADTVASAGVSPLEPTRTGLRTKDHERGRHNGVGSFHGSSNGERRFVPAHGR